MSDFTLLHLSDVHFGMDDPNNEMPLVTKNLITAVHNAGIPPDLCVFSGDLAQAGKAEQFQQGMAWLQEVMRPFDCPLAIVPGNHDLVRDPGKKRNFRAADRDDKSFADWRGDLNDPSRFQAFIDHCSFGQTLSSVRCLFDWSPNRYASFHSMLCNGLTINLIGLNTARTSVDNDDEGRLVTDLRKLNEYLAKTNSSQELTLAIGHHPLELLVGWNQKEIRTALARHNQGAHIWLCGHRHESDSTTFASGKGQALVTLAAGAAYQPTKYAQHFAFYRFDLGRSRIYPTVFGYNKVANVWDLQPALSKEFVATLPPKPKATSAPQVSSSIPVTKIKPTPFDAQIKENIRLVLTDDLHSILKDLLYKEAERDEISLGNGDLADLLCAPQVALDRAVAWLTLVAQEYQRVLRRKRSDDLPSFKRSIQEVLGWLLLRSVDPDWLAKHQAMLRRAKGARIQVSLRRPSCIEVAVAGSEPRDARFRTADNGHFRMGANTIQLGGEAGFDPPSTLHEVRNAIWRDVVHRPLPKTFGVDEMHEVNETLSTSALIRQHFYLAVALGDRSSHLTDADLDQLHADFPTLRLILIHVDSEDAPLLLDEVRLDRLIHNFFAYVIEEKTTA